MSLLFGAGSLPMFQPPTMNKHGRLYILIKEGLKNDHLISLLEECHKGAQHACEIWVRENRGTGWY